MKHTGAFAEIQNPLTNNKASEVTATSEALLSTLPCCYAATVSNAIFNRDEAGRM